MERSSVLFGKINTSHQSQNLSEAISIAAVRIAHRRITKKIKITENA